jgi:hypothetical protein
MGEGQTKGRSFIALSTLLVSLGSSSQGRLRVHGDKTVKGCVGSLYPFQVRLG